MNIRLNDVIIFIAGASIGSVVTWKLVKTKYEKMYQVDEEDSLIDEEENDDIEEECEEEDSEETESHVLEEMRGAYAAIAKKAGYINNKEEEENKMGLEKPYLISPDDFDTVDYNTESLNYYADGVLTDQYDNPIDDPEELIGDIDPEEHFGEYEDDSVFVRNDAKKCDYEILKDTRTYYEDDEEE